MEASSGFSPSGFCLTVHSEWQELIGKLGGRRAACNLQLLHCAVSLEACNRVRHKSPDWMLGQGLCKRRGWSGLCHQPWRRGLISLKYGAVRPWRSVGKRAQVPTKGQTDGRCGHAEESLLRGSRPRGGGLRRLHIVRRCSQCQQGPTLSSHTSGHVARLLRSRSERGVTKSKPTPLSLKIEALLARRAGRLPVEGATKAAQPTVANPGLATF